MFVTEAGSLHDLPNSRQLGPAWHDQGMLGEISGKFSCQSEHCLSIIIHCCLKLAHTYPQDMVPIFKKLICFRNMIFDSATVTPNEDIQERFTRLRTYLYTDVLKGIAELCREHFNEEDDKQVKWWRSLQVFLEVLYKRHYWGDWKYQQEDDFKASIDPVLKVASDS